MTRTVQCPECGVVLHVPEEAAGRKLKCPKCATKFLATPLGLGDSVIAESGPSSHQYPTRKGTPSSGTFDLPTLGDSSGSIELPTVKPRGSSGDFDLPSSPAPLRETFDLPLLDEAPSRSSGQHRTAPGSGQHRTAPGSGQHRTAPGSGQQKPPSGSGQQRVPAPATQADALALFQDEPKSSRKPIGAEARSKPRRCPSCGGVVGIGMSLCNTCGLDLDTGQRITPLEVFEDAMPEVTRQEIPGLGVIFVGSIAALLNLLLAIAALVGYSKGQGAGMLCLMVIWGFGIYASAQFLRRKSVRPLALALGLGVAIGVVYLIALPIWEVNVGTDATTNPLITTLSNDALDADAPQLRNIADQLDMRRITWGIAVLLAYAALSVYLNSPAIKREFQKR